MGRWIFCFGMSDESNDFTYQLIKCVIGNDNLIDLKNIGSRKINELDEKFSKPGSIILIKGNEYFEGLRQLDKERRLVVINTIRDIRDVYAYLAIKTKKEFKDIYNEYVNYKIFKNQYDLQSLKNVLSIKYESFIENFDTSVSELLAFLFSHQIPIQNKIVKSTNTNEKIGVFIEKLSIIDISTIQMDNRKWLNRHGYKIFPTVFNFKLIFLTYKVFNHLISGTLLDRITNSHFQSIKAKIKISKGEYLQRLPFSKYKILVKENDYLGKKLVFSNFEEEEQIFFKRYLKKGDNYLDVGTNIGILALTASQYIGKKGRVYAFEPAKDVYNQLIENIKINQIGNIKAFNLALSSKNESLVLHKSIDGYSPWNTFGKLTKGNFEYSEIVQCVTLDDFIKKNNINKVSLIKIDVEGWEIPALNGGYETLSSNNSPVLVVEFTDENAKNAGYTCKDLYKKIENYGYKLYSYDAKSNKFSHSPLKDSYPYENLFCIKDIRSVTLRLDIDNE